MYGDPELAPDVVEVMNDSDKITRPMADQILLMVEGMAGDDYAEQRRLIARIQKLLDCHFTWEDVRFTVLFEMVCEIRKTQAQSGVRHNRLEHLKNPSWSKPKNGK